MEILGQKKLTLNNGDEYIRLLGVIDQRILITKTLSNLVELPMLKFLTLEQEMLQIHQRKDGCLN